METIILNVDSYAISIRQSRDQWLFTFGDFTGTSCLAFLPSQTVSALSEYVYILNRMTTTRKPSLHRDNAADTWVLTLPIPTSIRTLRVVLHTTGSAISNTQSHRMEVSSPIEFELVFENRSLQVRHLPPNVHLLLYQRVRVKLLALLDDAHYRELIPELRKCMTANTFAELVYMFGTLEKACYSPHTETVFASLLATLFNGMIVNTLPGQFPVVIQCEGHPRSICSNTYNPVFANRLGTDIYTVAKVRVPPFVVIPVRKGLLDNEDTREYIRWLHGVENGVCIDRSGDDYVYMCWR